ncbi:Uma2 family endonuclease [Gloeothece citriformis]|nr:Uma2 family endonuclease [Gloeothece citriformis]
MSVVSRQSTQLDPSVRLWTVEEYYRMAEVGILQPDERVELIAGKIYQKMSPQGTPHAVTITLVRRVFAQGLGETVLIRTQLPIRLNNYSEPEPDVAVVIPDELRYVAHHPYPEDILLLIEVADKTLKRDCQLKAKEYANSGIKDYWVLDVNKRQLYLFRDPTEEGYSSQVILSEDEEASPLDFSEMRIRVRDILPPISV